MNRILFLIVLLVTFAPVHANEQGEDYRLGGGDLIRVSVFQNPDFDGERRVSENGEITFPLVGAVSVGDLTVRQAEMAIAKRLSDAIPHR